MGHTRIQRVQDTIHGLMEFQGMETSVVEVLRAQELQRLRRVRQLGLAHLVFPGAEHSRLVHSIGASHLAIRFAKHLQEIAQEFLVPFFKLGDSEIRDLALAALCHDLGHGPLSHVWEREVVGETFDRIAWCKALGIDDEPGLATIKWHELVGQALLAWPDGQLHRLLEQQEEGTSTRVRKLMAKEYYIDYLPRLLSGDVDLDRCDFILRDAHETGVAYGRYDLNWLISTATLGNTADRKLVVGFDKRKAPRVIEQFLVARRALYDTVYFHKTVRSAEGMIGLLLKRLKEITKEKGWVVSDTKLFSPFKKVVEGEPLKPNEILGLDDYSLWSLIQQLSGMGTEDATVADLARRIIERDLFKIVPCGQDRLYEFLQKQDAHQRLHDAVSPFCVGKKEYYVHIDNASFKMFCDSPTEYAYFVDSDSETREASPIRDHHQLRVHWQETQRIIRLFVPREAVSGMGSAPLLRTPD
jgi:HD superfamily phosphohydrolase